MNPDEGLGIAGIGFEHFKAAVAGDVGDLDAVRGRRKVGKLNIDGDGQADLQGHGGEHRAVLVYQIDSYRARAKGLLVRTIRRELHGGGIAGR